MKKITLVFVLILHSFLIWSCDRRQEQPRLVVFLVLDQCRPDLITHYAPLYTGGLKWILDHGLECTQVYHEHGYTATGPGHFALTSGQYPGPAGVLGNNWWDRETQKVRYCVEDKDATILGGEGEGRSFRSFNTTALGDWLKTSDPRSKVVSVAGKDRASVFMGGHDPDIAIWYNWDGHFVTSDYYTESLPDWLVAFNENSHIETYRDSIWTKSLPDSVYLKYTREDFYPGEVDSYRNEPYSPEFPIGFDHKDDIKSVLTKIGGTPWFDKLTLDVAKAAIHGESLGQDEYPDIVFISLSGVDWMIHYFGPFSQEAMDSQIKLDRRLGEFINWLDKEIGLDQVLLIQTSDHGGLPLPEYLMNVHRQNAGRIDAKIWKMASQALEDNLVKKTGIKGLVAIKGPGFYINDKLLSQTRIPRAEILETIRTYFEPVPGIDQILFRDDILKATPEDSLLYWLRHSTNEAGPDAWALEKRNWVWKYPFGTGHGSPYSYDRHVPLYFCRSNTKTSQFNDRMATVDIAPTLSRYLGIEPTHPIDGSVVDKLVTYLEGF